MIDEPKEEALVTQDTEESKSEKQTEEGFHEDLMTPDTVVLENDADIGNENVVDDEQELDGGIDEVDDEKLTDLTKVEDKTEEELTLDNPRETNQSNHGDSQSNNGSPPLDKRATPTVDTEPQVDDEQPPTADIDPEYDDNNQFEDELSDRDESTVINNENYDRNNDSAYETIEMNSQPGTDSRLQSADLNENEIDNETGENFIPQDIPQNIEIIDDDMRKVEREDLTIDRFVNDSVTPPSPSDSDDRDVVVSAGNPTETGYGLVHDSRVVHVAGKAAGHEEV
jgi:hypothetical protein